MISRRKLIKASAGLIAAPFILKSRRANAAGLTISVIQDSSWASAPAALQQAFSDAVAFLAGSIAINTTVTITIVYAPLAGGAISSSTPSSFTPLTYANLVTDLTNNAQTAEARQANSTLPGTDPTGGNGVYLTIALARALVSPGLAPSNDGTITMSSNATWYNANRQSAPGNGSYDAYGESFHELTEVMGRQMGDGGFISPLCLFRWAAGSPPARVLDPTSFTASYFSIDSGTTNLKNFNSSGAGDVMDWQSSGGLPADSFNDQNAPNHANPYSAVDQTLMDVIGWTPANTGQRTFGFVQ